MIFWGVEKVTGQKKEPINKGKYPDINFCIQNLSFCNQMVSFRPAM
jgi:hypothetical protein